MLVKELIEQLGRMNPDETICNVMWQMADVQALDSTVSDDQAADVLEAVEHRHDCNDGISWDTLQFHIDSIGE